MPELDGFEFVDELDNLFEIAEIEKTPAITILTSSNHKRDIEKFNNTPFAVKMFQKPLDIEKLKSITGL